MLIPTMLSEYNQIKAVLLAREPSEQKLKELDSVYIQAGDQLSPEQISDIPKLLPVIFKCVLDDDENVRKVAISILTKLAKALEENQYLKSGDHWTEFKDCIIKSVPRLTVFLENDVKEWCQIWCIIVKLYGSQLISDTSNINCLLKIVERAFKMKDDQTRLVGFSCWNALIDNFSLVPPETNSRYLNLILIPLKAQNHSNKVLSRGKLQTWKHLVKQIEHNDANVKLALPSFLQFLFEEVGSVAPASHYFPEEAAQCFLDIVKRSIMFRLLPDKCVKYATKCIVSISTNSFQALEVWSSILDGLKNLLWPDEITFELVNTLKELNYKMSNPTLFAHIVITTLSGPSSMPVRVQTRHFEILVMFVLTPKCLQKINENELLHFLDILKSTIHVHIKFFKDMLDSLVGISNRISTSEENRNSNILTSVRTVWLSLAITMSDWFKNGGKLSQDVDKVAEEINFVHMMLMCGCANLSPKWNRRMLKQWNELYIVSHQTFILHPLIKQNQIIVDFVNLLLTGLQSDKISLSVAIDVAGVLLEIHHSTDAENLMSYLIEIAERCIKALRDNIPSGMSVINQYLSALLTCALHHYSLVPHIAVVTEKIVNFKQDLPAFNTRIYNKIMKVHLQVLAMKPPEKSEVRSSSPTVTSFMHRLAKAKQNRSQSTGSSPLRDRCLTPQLTVPNSPNTTSPKSRQSKAGGDSQVFVMIPPKPRTTPLTEHQKEQLFARPYDIPALYQDLSQDTQSQSNSFEVLVSSGENKNHGHFLRRLRETTTDKSEGETNPTKNLLKVMSEASNKSFAIERTNEAVSLDVSAVISSDENNGVSEIVISPVENDVTQKQSMESSAVGITEPAKEDANCVGSEDLLPKKRKSESEQNFRAKDGSKNMHKTLSKDTLDLNIDSQSTSLNNIRITRSATKPKSMRRSISLPIMGKSNTNKSDDFSTPRTRRRKQEERGSSVEPTSSQKDRFTSNNLNVSVNERRVTRQSCENINTLHLQDKCYEGNTNSTRKRGNVVQKITSGPVNDIKSEKLEGALKRKSRKSVQRDTSTEKQDDVLISKLRRSRRKSTVSITENTMSNEDAESSVKSAKGGESSEAKESENLNFLSNLCDNKEPLSISVSTENTIISDKTEENYKKSSTYSKERRLNERSNGQLETDKLKNSVDRNIETHEEGRVNPAIIEKDNVNLKRTDNVSINSADKNQKEEFVYHSEEAMDVEVITGDHEKRVNLAVVSIDRCDKQLHDVEQMTQTEKVDSNANIKRSKKDLKEPATVENLCESENKLAVVKELLSRMCDKNKQSEHIVKAVTSDKSDAIQLAPENKTITKNRSSNDSVINKELKIILERSPAKQGTNYVASKILSPVKVRKLGISGNMVTDTPKTSCDRTLEAKTTKVLDVSEDSAAPKTPCGSPRKNRLTESILEEENHTTPKSSHDSPQKNKTTKNLMLAQESSTSRDGPQKNKTIKESTVISDSITTESCESPRKNKTTEESMHIKESKTTKTSCGSPHKNKITAESIEDVTASSKMPCDSPQKNTITTESADIEENLERIAEHSTEKANRSESIVLHVEDVDSIRETCVENINSKTRTNEETVSDALNSVTFHNKANDKCNQECVRTINKVETQKIPSPNENKSPKYEEAHKRNKVTSRKNAENTSPYNKKFSDPKKQTTLTTLNKWILRTPTKTFGDTESSNTNAKKLDTSKAESQDMLESQDIVESSQELLPKEGKHYSTVHNRFNNNHEQGTDIKPNISIVCDKLISNNEQEKGTKANHSVVIEKLHNKPKSETDIKTNSLTKTEVQCSSPVRCVVSLTPLQEGKNLSHVLKSTPTKKSVCRRLDKEIEGVHKMKCLEQIEKENCKSPCTCKYTNKLETLPINPAFHVDETGNICDDSSKVSSQVCNPEHKQRKPDIVNILNDDDDIDDDDLFDIKRRKVIASEKQSDMGRYYLALRSRTRNINESNSYFGIKNGSPVHRRIVSSKENGSPLGRPIVETNQSGSPLSGKLESPTKNGSPPSNRILKSDVQISPSSRTAHLIELAKQDPTGNGNFYSPVKLGSARVRRVRPTKLIGNELTSVDLGGAKEDWVCRTYSPSASPNTSILKRKVYEMPDIITPNSKRKRVSFCDPPVSESLVFSNNEPGKGQVQRPEQKKGVDSFMEVDGSETQVESNDPIFPSLEFCRHPVTKVLEKFISSHWLDQMETTLDKINVHTVGDLSTMSESAVYRLLCCSFKLETLKQALQEYYENNSSKEFLRSSKSNSLDTELMGNDLQGIAALPSESPEIKQQIKHVTFKKSSEENKDEQSCDNLSVDNIVSEIEKNPEIVDDLGNKLDISVIMKMLTSAVNKIKNT